jgi:hypothetical protein
LFFDPKRAAAALAITDTITSAAVIDASSSTSTTAVAAGAVTDAGMSTSVVDLINGGIRSKSPPAPAVVDLMDLLPDECCEVCILEEPEHLNW